MCLIHINPAEHEQDLQPQLRINVNSVRFCKTTNKLNVSLCCNFTFVSV